MSHRDRATTQCSISQLDDAHVTMRASASAALKARAEIFAALGDATRLLVLDRLSRGTPQSIVRLTAGTRLTRQAVTKHLRVLEAAGVVRSVRAGRESLFALEPKLIDDLRRYLESVSAQWDDALARLKTFVEE
jgi:DNA-binding transcriptional ArsR family regulator